MKDVAPCRLVEVYGFAASSGLPMGESPVCLTKLQDSTFSAVLDENPSSKLRHLDTCAVIASRLVPGGLPSLSDRTTREQEIKKAKSRREQTRADNVYVVFEGATTVEFNSHGPQFHSSEFNVCFDGFSNSMVADSFRSRIRDILCALVLSHSKSTIGKIGQIGSICFLVDSSNKPTYNFNPSMSAKISIASPTTREMINDTIDLVSIVPNYRKISRLIVKSLDGNSNDLQSFICAWTALEIFVHTTRPGNEKVRQKFVSIAQLLNPSNAVADELEFARLKEFRDSYFHSSCAEGGSFPTTSIHNLLLNYLNLRIRSEVFDAEQQSQLNLKEDA